MARRSAVLLKNYLQEVRSLFQCEHRELGFALMKVGSPNPQLQIPQLLNMLIDLVFALIIVMAIIKGYQKGLIIAVFSMIAFIIGLAAALKLSTVVAAYLKDNTSVSAK